MCGYAGQDSSETFVKSTEPIDMTPDYKNAINHEADWVDLIDILNTDRPRPIEEQPIGGIGDFFTIHYKLDQDLVKDWAKFGSNRELFPGKKIMYYNAQIEKIEGYHESAKPSKFGRQVLEDVELRPCVIFVDRFWERDKQFNTGYYKIQRADGEMIPLAGFWIDEHLFNSNDIPVQSYPAFTIITKDPYPAIGSIGHHRSPVILEHDQVLEWLDHTTAFDRRLELIAAPGRILYQIDRVDSKSVTKRLPEALNSLDQVNDGLQLAQGF